MKFKVSFVLTEPEEDMTTIAEFKEGVKNAILSELGGNYCYEFDGDVLVERVDD